MDSPGSPLSELSSDDFEHEVEPTRASLRSNSVDPYRDHSHSPPDSSARPLKRQRVSASMAWDNLPQPPSDAEISSDTDGSVPGSPHYAGGGGKGEDDDEGPAGREQITFCKWDGCDAGDLGNMDELVQHLHDEHIQARQKKYSCEWADCSRKGIAHASGYALRAHMRSHTREKPFYCSLPECDRSFTRSDALAKHMRTVHETEALRPSDPVPKHHSSNPQNKAQRLRLTLKGLAPANGANGQATGEGSASGSMKDPLSAVKSNASNPNSPGIGPPNGQSAADIEYEHNNVTYEQSMTGQWERHFPPDVQFLQEEMDLPPAQLYALLKAQVKWATEDGEDLRATVEQLEKTREQEWVRKELLVENVLEGEFADGEKKNRLKEDVRMRLERDAEAAKKLDIPGAEKLWWRQANGTAEEAPVES